MANEAHAISKSIVKFARSNFAAIAIEDLNGIRERLRGNKQFRTLVHGWSFRKLATYIEYKATLAGIPLIKVDPRKTSQTCPNCDYAAKGNRRSQAQFACKFCGYRANADHVGARNIARRGLLTLGLGLDPSSTGGCDTAQREGHLPKVGLTHNLLGAQ
jgi:IS605 OrfB family transposase